MSDPARPPQRTIEDRRRADKKSCISTPCGKVTNAMRYPCTFCPHEKEWLRLVNGADK